MSDIHHGLIDEVIHFHDGEYNTKCGKVCIAATQKDLNIIRLTCAACFESFPLPEPFVHREVVVPVLLYTNLPN